MSDTPNIFQAGNTVRLQCIFEDFDGNRINPETVKIIFYDNRYNVMHETLLGAGNRLETGLYVYNFRTSKEEEKMYVYEWYGEISGLPSLKRSSFRTIFV